jgi:hypothetical protein
MREWEKQAKHCVFCCTPRLQLWFMLLTQQQNPIRTTPGTPSCSHHTPTWWGFCCMIIALVRHGSGIQSPCQTSLYCHPCTSQACVVHVATPVPYTANTLYAPSMDPAWTQHGPSMDPAWTQQHPHLEPSYNPMKGHPPGIAPDHHPMLGRYNTTPYRSTLCGLSLYGSTPRLYHTHGT